MKNKIVKSGLKIGDKVQMVNCYEAEKYKDVVWIVKSDCWEIPSCSELVLLEGFRGGFDTSRLRLVERAGAK